MNQELILFLSHKEKRCGVYQFGLNLSRALKKSKKYNFVYAEISNFSEYDSVVTKNKPSAIIYNYYNSTMPWLNNRTLKTHRLPHVGILHEVTQRAADVSDDSLFQFHIAPDPTLLLKNPIVFKTGRLIPKYDNRYPLPQIPTIGSFGFGFEGKGFERVIATVQKEYDHAIVKLQMSFAAFGDVDGNQAKVIAERCRKLITKPGIQLSISHEFLSQESLLDFLAGNTLNAFFYDKFEHRGISAVIDLALASRRPIAVTKSHMFRHVTFTVPSICIEDSNLKTIVANGCIPLERFWHEWTEENLIWDYERHISKIIAKYDEIRRLRTVSGRIKQVFSFFSHRTSLDDNKLMFSDRQDNGISEVFAPGQFICHPIELPEDASLNRILDNKARQLYGTIIDQLFKMVPDMMARKIPEANVQQAFVLDTVIRFSRQMVKPKLLCVGSYEDSAYAALRRLGFPIEEIDPALNYDLNTFMYKPSTTHGSFNIVFSTSVLEHVKDDELFLKQISDLLAPGGVAILTCDYNDQYKPGDRIPQTDFRFYTQNDFKNRLLPLIKECELVDTPQWDCPNPDFRYDDCQYTFATLVFRKIRK